MRELLDGPMNKKEQKELEREQKRIIVQTEHEFRQEKEKRLEEYFRGYADKEERNTAIYYRLWYLLRIPNQINK
ncbi:MAG TPA: hypothetical protein ENK72_01830 [Epsilonproteobacteria bacterium]|nr:hypothetical protein [Campylobacterota bacterium]